MALCRHAIKIYPKFVLGDPINNPPALVLIVVWRLSGDTLLSEPYWHIGRGLCTYIRKGVEYREVNVNSSFEEFLAVEIQLNNNNQKMLILNVYRSGNCDEGNNDYLNELLVNIGQIGTMNRSWYVVIWISETLTGKIFLIMNQWTQRNLNSLRQPETPIWNNI